MDEPWMTDAELVRCYMKRRDELAGEIIEKSAELDALRREWNNLGELLFGPEEEDLDRRAWDGVDERVSISVGAAGGDAGPGCRDSDRVDEAPDDHLDSEDAGLVPPQREAVQGAGRVLAHPTRRDYQGGREGGPDRNGFGEGDEG